MRQPHFCCTLIKQNFMRCQLVIVSVTTFVFLFLVPPSNSAIKWYCPTFLSRCSFKESLLPKKFLQYCCDIGQTSIGKNRCQDDIFPRIELFPLSSLSSDNTNCKNDIQLFHQLFDELCVYRDYH